MASLSVDGSLLLTSADESSFAPLFSDEWLGTELWPAAKVLAGHLEQQREALGLANLLVVELGAGTGACGLAAALLGSEEVLLTDKPSLLPSLERNARANGACPSVRCAALEWHSVATAGLGDEVPCGADLVLMSDCLNPVYGPNHASGLAWTLRALLSRRAETLSEHASEPLGLLAQTRRGRCEAEATFFAECERCQLRATLIETVEIATGSSTHEVDVAGVAAGDRRSCMDMVMDQSGMLDGARDRVDEASAAAVVVGLYKIVLSR